MRRNEREFERRLQARFRRGVCSIDVVTTAASDLLEGPDAPSPDPAIGQAANKNAAVGQEALNFSKEQWADQKAIAAKFQPYIEQVLQQQIRLGEKNETAADDYINYMKSTFRPMEQSLAKDAMEFDTEARRTDLAGKAASDVEQAAGLADASARRDAARYGINPGDAAFAENLAGSSLNKTILKVGAMNQARTAARAEGRALKFDVAGLGRGLPGAGATASSVALNAGNAAVNTSTVPGATSRANAGTMFQGYNTAMSGNQSAGNLYSGVFDANMRRYGADQQANAAMWGGLGTVAGMGAYALLSSKATKVKKGTVSAVAMADKMKTLPVDKWVYKKDASPDQDDHIGTYAEDFKERFGVGDGKRINVIDAIGVTMAAVKGLAQRMDQIAGSGARMARKGVAWA